MWDKVGILDHIGQEKGAGRLCHVCGDDWPVGDVKEKWSPADVVILGDIIYTFHYDST